MKRPDTAAEAGKRDSESRVDGEVQGPKSDLDEQQEGADDVKRPDTAAEAGKRASESRVDGEVQGPKSDLDEQQEGGTEQRRQAPKRRLRKKAKQKVQSNDDALEEAIMQADEERAAESDILERMWKKERGLAFPSPADGQGSCGRCGRSVEGHKALQCSECSLVLCAYCCITWRMHDLGYDTCQLKDMSHSAVFQVVSAWART